MWRSFIYPGEIPRTYDHLAQWKDNLIAISLAIGAMVGTNTPLLSGFGLSAQTSPNLTVNVAPGQIFQLNTLDPTPYGSCGSDSSQVYQQGVLAASQIVTLLTSQLTSGQNQYALIQVSFAQVDTVRPNDPSGGLLAYFNSNAPNQPLQGQAGNGAVQPTVRQALATVSVIYGSPAAAGSAIPPQPSSNALPLALVLLQFGEIAINQSGILAPNTYTGYAYAPLLPGMTQSHHGGFGGQAPKIILTGGAEVQGITAYPNLPVTNQSPPATGNTNVVQGAKIPVVSQVSVNPNGNFAGGLGDFILFGTALYQCTTASAIANGTGQAVWTQVGGAAGPPASYFNTSPYNITGTYGVWCGDATAGSLTANLPLVSSVSNCQITVLMCGIDALESHNITVAPSGTDKFFYNGSMVSVLPPLLQLGDSRTFIPFTIPSGPNAGTYWSVT